MAAAEQLLPEELREKPITTNSKITIGIYQLVAYYTLSIAWYGVYFTFKSVRDHNDSCWNQLNASSLAVLIQIFLTTIITVLTGHITCMYSKFIDWYREQGDDRKLMWISFLRINFTNLTLIILIVFSNKCYYFWPLYTLAYLFNILFYTTYQIK